MDIFNRDIISKMTDSIVHRQSKRFIDSRYMYIVHLTTEKDMKGEIHRNVYNTVKWH